MTKIEITTDTNPTGWGSDCGDALAQVAAEKLAAMLATFAREEWPEAEIETRTRHYSDGESIEWARVTGTDAETANNIEAAIGDFVEASWEEALQEALSTQSTIENPCRYCPAEVAVASVLALGEDGSHDQAELCGMCLDTYLNELVPGENFLPGQSVVIHYHR